MADSKPKAPKVDPKTVDCENYTYEQWMKFVDACVYKHVCLTTNDLADTNTRDMYEGGDSAEEAARNIIEYNCEDMGIDPESILGDE